LIGRAIDKLIAVFSPEAALRRMSARSSLESIEKLFGGQAGYEAAAINRLNVLRANVNENAIPGDALDRLASSARDLWRNNPHARKVVRQIQTKTIGTGMRPIPQASQANGSPHFEFRRRCKLVWNRWLYQSDYRGFPGKGGQHFTDQAKTALGSIVRQGNLLYRIRRLNYAEMRSRNLMLPITVQLIDGDRLDDSIRSAGENSVYRGVEFDANNRIVAYHILDAHPSDPRSFSTSSTRVDARDIGHVFVSDDIDQVLGVSWFAPALTTTRDVGDYTYAELKAAAMGACFVAGVKGNTGSGTFGAQSSAGDATDEDGNPISRVRPGMFLNLRGQQEFFAHDPKRPNANAEPFTQHLLRTVSTAFPGIKGSSLTGDYRGSSFSSERSADNEIWPEIEGVQQWMSCSFHQPIYEEVILAAVLMGMFDDIVSREEIADRYDELMICKWQGPVARSINPVDDRTAGWLGVRNGTSSVQLEAAKDGNDAYELLEDLGDYVRHIEDSELPDAIKSALLMHAIGNEMSVNATTGKSDETESDDDVSPRWHREFA